LFLFSHVVSSGWLSRSQVTTNTTDGEVHWLVVKLLFEPTCLTPARKMEHLNAGGVGLICNAGLAWQFLVVLTSTQA
jgi:hypothetical protein